jgi:Xaa-Pro aminopeptidase
MTSRISGQIESRTYPTNVDGGGFSSAEYARRYERVAQLMRDRDLSAILFYGARGGGDIHYLSNWVPSMESFLLWPLESEPTLFVQLFNHVPQARQMSVVKDVRFGGSNDRGAVDSSGELLAAVRDKGLANSRIGVSGAVPYRTYDRLRSELGGAELVDVSADLRNIRTIRSEEEFERIARAASLSDRAIQALAESAAPGMTELDLGRIVDDAQAYEGGYTTLRHMVSTPMANPNACVPAKYLTDRRLEKGDFFVVELSAGWGGYSGQVLRTFTVAAEPTAQIQEMHEVTLRAYEAARATIRDGAVIDDLLDAVNLIDEAGFSICDDLLHGANQFAPILRTWQTSHGVPRGMTFREGMAVVLQPNVITKDGSTGVQYGQMLRVTRDGVEDLHHALDGLIVCGGA